MTARHYTAYISIRNTYEIVYSMCNRSFNITSHVCSVLHRHITFAIHTLLFTSLNILLKYISGVSDL